MGGLARWASGEPEIANAGHHGGCVCQEDCPVLVVETASCCGSLKSIPSQHQTSPNLYQKNTWRSRRNAFLAVASREPHQICGRG
jgi:hypothetical protein